MVPRKRIGYEKTLSLIVIKVGAGTEAVGIFESIHLFVYKLMLQNAINGVKRRACFCLEQNGERFRHLL
jgi:hypothetical protein